MTGAYHYGDDPHRVLHPSDQARQADRATLLAGVIPPYSAPPSPPCCKAQLSPGLTDHLMRIALPRSRWTRRVGYHPANARSAAIATARAVGWRLTPQSRPGQLRLI